MDVQQYVQLLNESNKSPLATSSSASLESSTKTGPVDEVARWWAAVISLGAYWLNGDDEAANRLYPTVDALPKQLYNSE